MPFSGVFSGSRKPKSFPPGSPNGEVVDGKDLKKKHRPVSVKLVDGEIVHGWVEYYDRNMIRVTRDGKPNLFIYKNQIAYLAEEAG